ncbi:MAG: dUTP diphosphatase [bacterium]|nr:dUTP diphosphatase [bacterium]
MKVKIKKLNESVKLPTYAHAGDAGLDLFSLEDFELLPGSRYNFFVGFALEFSDGYVAIVKDKSGLPKNYGLHVLGGVFDSCYRGEYNVTLINLGAEPHQILTGDKIAQLLIIPCERAEFEETGELSDSQRGEGRFGSSGK